MRRRTWKELDAGAWEGKKVFYTSNGYSIYAYVCMRDGRQVGRLYSSKDGQRQALSFLFTVSVLASVRLIFLSKSVRPFHLQ